MKPSQNKPTPDQTPTVTPQPGTGAMSDAELDQVTGARGSDAVEAELRERTQREITERLNRERQEEIRRMINGGG